MRLLSLCVIVCVCLLTAVGLVTLYSVDGLSGASAVAEHHRYFSLQLRFVLAGVALAAVAAAVPPDRYLTKRGAVFFGACVLLALAAVHVPGLAKSAKGASRWIRIGSFSLQPSEFVKLLLIVILSWWCGSMPRDGRAFWKRLFGVHFIVIGAAALGFLLQHDYGSAVMSGTVGLTLCLISGVRWGDVGAVALLAFLALAVLIAFNPERRSRVSSVWMKRDVSAEDARKRSQGDDYQIEMALSAFARGGLHGVGIGNGLYKMRYLPDNHTDFILSMVGEEGGFIFTGLCWFLYFMIFISGFFIASGIRDKKRRILAYGLTLHLALNAAVNIGVVTGAFPTKGLALPFLSYGGSNMLASLAAAGLLVGLGFRYADDPARTAAAAGSAAAARRPKFTTDWDV